MTNERSLSLTETVKQLELAVGLDLDISLVGQRLVDVGGGVALEFVRRDTDADEDQQRGGDEPLRSPGTAREGSVVGNLLVRARRAVELLVGIAVVGHD